MKRLPANSTNFAMRMAFGSRTTRFFALKLALTIRPWWEWDEPLRNREAEAIAAAREEHDEEIFAQKFYQFEFFRQWNAVKGYANEKGISIIGDLASTFARFVRRVVQSRRVQIKRRQVAQRWWPVFRRRFQQDGPALGKPDLRLGRDARERFSMVGTRFAVMLRMFDIIRIDHFIGFTRAWEVPGGGQDGGERRMGRGARERAFSDAAKHARRCPDDR